MSGQPLGGGEQVNVTGNESCGHIVIGLLHLGIANAPVRLSRSLMGVPSATPRLALELKVKTVSWMSVPMVISELDKCLTWKGEAFTRRL